MDNNKNQICQSCGMPMQNDNDFGTNADGSKNAEYCTFCFQNGKFADDGITLNGKIEKNIKLAVGVGMSENKARTMANEIIPKLKRWKKTI
ncbi:MAG: zinc ribbon domain-containing protein [Patescibacteria group bacterium]